jgi:hypothetical protein
MGAWNADGKGLSIWDVYADTLGKINNEDTGGRRQRPLPPPEVMSSCKIESPRSSSNAEFVLPVLGWIGKGVHLRPDV